MCRKNNTTEVFPAIPLLLFFWSTRLLAVAPKFVFPPPLNLTAGYVTATVRLHDHRRIACYPPAFRYHHLVLITHKHFTSPWDSTSWQAVKCGLRKLGNFLHRSHSVLGSVLRCGYKTSSDMIPFVEQSRMYTVYPTSAGYKAVMRRQSQTKNMYMQKFNHSFK